MPQLYYSPTFLQHETGSHPEKAARLEHVIQGLEASGVTLDSHGAAFSAADERAIGRVHDLEAVRAIEEFAAQGGRQIDGDTVVCPGSVGIARLASGAVCQAARQVVSGEAQSAFCAARPPGHHALASRAMGFCLINHVAVAAKLAIDELGLSRVLIVDWDVHHGNGTQDILYENGQIGYFSAHRSPFYPGTGAADETGSGDGLGATKNLPVKFGTPRESFLSWVTRDLEAFADHIKPELVILSAGFDGHRADPIGSLGLETEDFVELTQIVLGVAATHAAGRVVSVLEGGYNPPVLAECVVAHWRALSAAEATE